jgi:hypothetical protein
MTEAAVLLGLDPENSAHRKLLEDCVEEASKTKKPRGGPRAPRSQMTIVDRAKAVDLLSVYGVPTTDMSVLMGLGIHFADRLVRCCGNAEDANLIVGVLKDVERLKSAGVSLPKYYEPPPETIRSSLLATETLCNLLAVAARLPANAGSPTWTST